MRSVLSRLARVGLLAIIFVGTGGSVALGVVGGKRISVSSSPWTVVLWARSTYAGQPRYAACTGVIIDPLHVLTAGHCVMKGESATPRAPAAFTIEAGVSNFEHPLASDHPQFRTVSDFRALPGYIAGDRLTFKNQSDLVAHDLAVLTLSRPLDLSGDDARSVRLPSDNTPRPSRATRLVMAGFGNETNFSWNGTLNEVANSVFSRACSTSQTLCVFSKAVPCIGDSGAGLIERGPNPTVVGILSEGKGDDCTSDLDTYYVPLTAPAILRFTKASVKL